LRKETTAITAVIITTATMAVGVDIAVVIAGTAAMAVAVAMVAEIMDTGAIAVMGVVADTTVAGVVAVEDMVVTDFVYLNYVSRLQALNFSACLPRYNVLL